MTTTPSIVAAVQATAAFTKLEAAKEAVRRDPSAANIKAMQEAWTAWADLAGVSGSHTRARWGYLRRTAPAVMALLLMVPLAACVAPHQHAFDDAWARCRAASVGNGPECAQAYQLGEIVQQEKAEQAASAAALATGLLAVSAGIAAGYAASQPHYVAAPVYVYCPYGC